ncbi:MAG: hypothetical protein HQL72_04260 [Magnetococcales bacterium]|nr:hypothetical protein [Magnetococcales bacterium]
MNRQAINSMTHTADKAGLLKGTAYFWLHRADAIRFRVSLSERAYEVAIRARRDRAQTNHINAETEVVS